MKVTDATKLDDSNEGAEWLVKPDGHQPTVLFGPIRASLRVARPCSWKGISPTLYRWES